MSFKAFPLLKFADVYSQPSEQVYGRRLVVNFDSTNIYTTNDGYFSNSNMSSHSPIVIRVSGITIEGPTYEDFSILMPGSNTTGILHFTKFSTIMVISGNKIFFNAPYGVVSVKEALAINYIDGGSVNVPYVQFNAYGSGIFLFQTTTKDSYGNSVDPGYGQYEFLYSAPFQIPLKTLPDKICIGNSIELNNSIDGVMDEVKITSATATKTRTRQLAGSYDISTEASSPVFSEPDAKTLVLLHLDDNTESIIDSIRDPLDQANLSDTALETIVSFKNNRDKFIEYVDLLNITGTIVDGSIDSRPLSAQLFDLVSVLNSTINSAKYFKLSGKYFPSEIVVNNNFKYAAVFSGEQYSIEKPNLINNNEGSIEVWIAPLSNILGDFKRRIYFDSINHVVIGQDEKFFSAATNLIKLPNNISAKHINSIKLAGIAGESNTFNFSDSSFLSGDGTTITLIFPLPANNIAVIVDFIPLSGINDRMTLFKDEDSNLIFAISAGGELYQFSRNISSWQKNEWHRVMITWKANDINSLDHLNMYIDGIESSTVKYGQGFVFDTFTFQNSYQTITDFSKIIPQNIQFIGNLDKLYIGTDFASSQSAFCRMSNLRISFIERQPLIDSRGNRIDMGFAGGSNSATPQVQDSFTSYLENFDPQDTYITNFASAQDKLSGAHDLHIIIRDDFNLVRGVNDGRVERLLRELLKIIHPAEARLRITISNNN